ncbi:DNA polymerase epsilon subunit 4 [Dendrobates tinctorius]|uniref:DNA polymerase epsilon subunit 4 n=1 Tax=Dendrobates tinctorius TaxID=92724 RepID=UPI003CC99FAD
MAAEEEVIAGGAAAQPEAADTGHPENAAAPPAASQKLAKLPMSRIKSLMKSDPDVSLASQEAVFAISKATELFIEAIAKDAYVYAQRGKRKTLQRKDLDNAIDAFDEFAFLEGTLE